MIRRIPVTVAAAVLAAVVVSGFVAAPALAAPIASNSPIVLVSTDGISYQPSLSVGLFDNAGLLVPGDSSKSDLWIKNPMSTPATVRVNVGDVTSSSSDLADNIQLTVVDTANGSTVTATWSELASCSVMVEPVTIPGGAVLRVNLTLAMLNAPGLVAQHQDGSLTADVQMQDAAGGPFPPSTCTPNVTDPGTTNPGTTPPGTIQPAATHPHRVLGYTGETFPTQLLILGGVLVGIGWFLLVARRRRKREEIEQ